MVPERTTSSEVRIPQVYKRGESVALRTELTFAQAYTQITCRNLESRFYISILLS